jgi:hypothetical protein
MPLQKLRKWHRLVGYFERKGSPDAQHLFPSL